ncbi:MAG: hypothetical protein ACREKE_05615 [bacterium]
MTEEKIMQKSDEEIIAAIRDRAPEVLRAFAGWEPMEIVAALRAQLGR